MISRADKEDIVRLINVAGKTLNYPEWARCLQLIQVVAELPEPTQEDSPNIVGAPSAGLEDNGKNLGSE